MRKIKEDQDSVEGTQIGRQESSQRHRQEMHDQSAEEKQSGI